MTNEFEEIEEDFPKQEASSVPGQEAVDNSDLIAEKSGGTVYDFNKAPDHTKAPPRKDMNGMSVTIKEAQLILPSKDTPWDLTRTSKKPVKYCPFKILFDHEAQVEFYSGVRIFKVIDEKTKNEMYSHPSITRDRVSQVSDLLGKYADFKKKDINEVSMREFGSFLNSQPKVKIISKEFKNPKTNTMMKKNIIEKFV
jgi:hypothetical protein